MLKDSYKRELMRSAMFLVVVGDGRLALEEIATNGKFGLFGSDPEEFYNDLASRIPPVVYQGKESVSNIFDILGRHLEDKMREIGTTEYNQLTFKEAYVGTTTSQAEFTKLVKTAVNEQLGAEVVGIQAVNSILDRAIEKGHATKTTPIILGTDDLKLAGDLMRDLSRLTSKVFLIQAGAVNGTVAVSKEDSVLTVEEVNQATVKATLAQINKQIKR
jgi:hypothetical protein